MASAHQVMMGVSDAELRRSAQEALEWQRTGRREGRAMDELLEVVRRESGATTLEIQNIEQLVMKEVARRWIAQSG